MSDEELIKRMAIINDGCMCCCDHAYYVQCVGMCCDFDDICSNNNDYKYFDLNKEVLEKIYESY